MDSRPLISVIVPVYRVEKYIHQCVDSIINQTYKNLEIILVDDGSPDNCGKICDEYALKDSRVRVIHKKNEGVGFARNSGLETATGEYIGFIDCDDWVEADMYEYMMDLLLLNNADLCVCGYYDDFENICTASKKFNNKLLNRKEAFKFMLFDGNPAPWNKLHKRKILDGIRYPKAKIGEDLAVIFEVLKKTESTIITDAVKYHYRQRKSSVMKVMPNDEIENTLNVYDSNINIIEKSYPELAARAKEKKLLYYLFLINSSLKNGVYQNNQKNNEFTQVLRKNIGMIIKSKNIPLKPKVNICLLCTNRKLYGLIKSFQYNKESKKYVMFD